MQSHNQNGGFLMRLVVLYVCVLPTFALDLNEAVIVLSLTSSAREKKAAQMLSEEIEKRSCVRLRTTSARPAPDVPVVVVGSRTGLTESADLRLNGLLSTNKPVGPEGYRLFVSQGAGAPAVCVVGEDERGVLFGVGRLLRELHLGRGRVRIDDALDVSSAPKYALRGHQLGYRPKTNSYDAWDLPVWEQYYRDLIVFGCNAIELIPPRSDDDADSPHFPRPSMEMMVGMSKLADEYGLDVWIWYPAMDRDYSDPATVERSLREWGEVFSMLPRVDAVFVPGGDPGHTPPKVLMALLARQTENLHRFHPKAQLWVSPQGFNQAWMDEFMGILRHESPPWLSGIVFGPQVRLTLPRLRAAVPERYPIRHYPDITHSRQCQYTVHDWDTAFAVTLGRECINPRPIAHATIFRKTQPYTIGFITYSEGCNDDVNKMLWSALGWDPDVSVTNILRQYSRYFIGERYEEDFAQGLLALEKNWDGPLIKNAGVERTLARFQKLEKSAAPADLKNWRFQQALFRAYYDTYTQRRLIWETDLETRAMAELRKAPQVGSDAALAAAESVLNRAIDERVKPECLLRIHQLAEALFQSISMQLSAEKYKAIAVDRGASLDTVQFPLNNTPWLKHRFAAIRRLTAETDRLKAIAEIINWDNPGPGGFYDDLGNVGRQPHLVQVPGFEEDPSRMESVRVDFEEDLVLDSPDEGAGVPRRVSWIDHAESLYDTPLRMRYTGLDPAAHYRVRVVYAGDNFKRKIRLIANGSIEIHPYIERPVPVRPMEFPVPPEAVRDGELVLSWFGETGLGGNGRNCQVSEVWLIRE
ncbi:MAG: hypothetical protein QHJ82_05390 [Verrucomicrobiota bacterium]|nr:hypothetical protein [Verrucomicrobiota bacterium]